MSFACLSKLAKNQHRNTFIEKQPQILYCLTLDCCAHGIFLKFVDGFSLNIIIDWIFS